MDWEITAIVGAAICLPCAAVAVGFLVVEITEPDVVYEDADTICYNYYPTTCYDKATRGKVCSYQYGRGPAYDCTEG